MQFAREKRSKKSNVPPPSSCDECQNQRKCRLQFGSKPCQEERKLSPSLRKKIVNTV